MAFIGAPDPLWPHWSVGKVIGTCRLPIDIVGNLSTRFQVTQEESGGLSSEMCSRRCLHSLLGHLASGAETVLFLERLILIGFDRDGTVHLLHLFLSVLFDPYSRDQRLLELFGDLPSDPPPWLLISRSTPSWCVVPSALYHGRTIP